MKYRIDNLAKAAARDGARIGIISTWDVENNAVRILAATLREADHHCAEIYFKDWLSNHLDPATDVQLDNLIKVIRREQLNSGLHLHPGLCLRAAGSGAHGGHPGEARHPGSLGWDAPNTRRRRVHCSRRHGAPGRGRACARRPRRPASATASTSPDTQNIWVRRAVDDYTQNPLRPLVQNLDDLAYRDYTTHEHKYFINGNSYTIGDPMKGDPVFQMMGSRGCIYKCSYCYNSTYKKDVYPGQKWFRVRSPASMVDEIKKAREHWPMKRIRFDDEVFNFQKDWLIEFCEIYPREVGLPFEIFIEPKLVNEERMTMLRDAGLVSVYMGIQSSERVTGHLYDRRVKNRASKTSPRCTGSA